MLNTMTLSQQAYMNLQVSGSGIKDHVKKVPTESFLPTSLRVAAVLSEVDTYEVQLRTDNLPIAWIWSTQHRRHVITLGTVHLAVTAVPSGITVKLVLPLALVLSRLTVHFSWALSAPSGCSSLSCLS